MKCNICKFYHTGSCHRFPRPVQFTEDHWCGEYKSNVKRRQTKNSDEYSDGFKMFYEAYPKSKSPNDAWKAWQRIDESYHELIIDRAKAYASVVASEEIDIQYVKHPATWLNKGDWRDAVEAKIDPKDCVDCNKPYEAGFKYAINKGKKVYRCTECSNKRIV